MELYFSLPVAVDQLSRKVIFTAKTCHVSDAVTKPNRCDWPGKVKVSKLITADFPELRSVHNSHSETANTRTARQLRD
jgi:hypothetical protein